MGASGDRLESAVGVRVEYQGFRGTVCFAGEIAGQAGVWIGVEWDDPSRGKHDGSHNGVSYFKTSHPTSGSFVRPNKVNFGISCVEAIKDRYGKVDGSTAGIDENALSELKKAMNANVVEMVGFDKVNSKQSQFENLRFVDLSGMPVKCAGEQGQLYETCPLLIELKLCETLISSWQCVGDITAQLRELKCLDLSNNKLPVPNQAGTIQLQKSFQSIHSLILNTMGYTWDQVLNCASMWPSITCLAVEGNKIHELESPSFGVLSNLTSLSLQMNPIKDWNYVNKLGNLSSLQILSLNNTEIQEVFFPGDGKTSLFPSLQELSLQNNQIDNWCSINELNKLGSLHSLMLQSNPIMGESKAFDLVIGKVKGLKKLNRRQVTEQERRGCEYDYMKCYGREWVAARDDPVLLREFLRLHPRYPELIEKHGSISEEDITTAPKPLKSRLLNLKIVCSNSPDGPEFIKKVPKNMTIQKLTGLVQKLVDTGGLVPILQVRSAKAPGIEVSLEKDMQDLSFYSVEDGDTIAVSWCT